MLFRSHRRRSCQPDLHGLRAASALEHLAASLVLLLEYLAAQGVHTSGVGHGQSEGETDPPGSFSKLAFGLVASRRFVSVQTMITAFRIVCITILLAAFPFRAMAEDFTNAIHAYLQQCVEARKMGSSGITRGFFIGWFEGTGKKAKEFIGWNPGWAKPGQGGAT